MEFDIASAIHRARMTNSLGPVGSCWLEGNAQSESEFESRLATQDQDRKPGQELRSFAFELCGTFFEKRSNTF